MSDRHGCTLKDRSDEIIDIPEGTLYPVLHSLERDGMLRAHWLVAESGRRRKYYAITDRGRRDLGSRMAEWRTFAGAIEAVLSEDADHA